MDWFQYDLRFVDFRSEELAFNVVYWLNFPIKAEIFFKNDLLWIVWYSEDFFSPALCCILKNRYWQSIKKLIHHKYRKWHFLSGFFKLVVFFEQLLQSSIPTQTNILQLILSNKLLFEIVGFFEIKAEERFVLLKLIQNSFLLLFAIVLRNYVKLRVLSMKQRSKWLLILYEWNVRIMSCISIPLPPPNYTNLNFFSAAFVKGFI